MVYTISYDISDDRTRNKVSKILDDFGRRVQKSLFECRLDPDNISRLRRRLSRVKLEENDTVRIYSLCQSCYHRTEIFGAGELLEDRDVYVI